MESSIEIRELESKLRMAYILKERKKQIDEKVSARIYEKVNRTQQYHKTINFPWFLVYFLCVYLQILHVKKIGTLSLSLQIGTLRDRDLFF